MLDWALVVAGTLVGVLALAADLIGIGGYPGFGWRQAIGVSLALGLVALGGLRILRRGRNAGS